MGTSVRIDIQNYFERLPEYSSDTDAIADGVTTDSLYVTDAGVIKRPIGTAVSDTIIIPNASATAFLIEDDLNNHYVLIDTLAEHVYFGNATTSPTYEFLGTGLTTLNGAISTTRLTSTVTTGTAPFTVASTTNVANLNASLLNGNTFASPSSIGSTVANSGAFTSLTSSTTCTFSVTDNQTAIFQVLEGANSYLSLDTLNGDELWTFGNVTTNPSYLFAGSGLALFKGLVRCDLIDNSSVAFKLQEGTNTYFNVSTTNTSESMTYGNTTTNPIHNFNGSGLATFGGSVLSLSTITGTRLISNIVTGTAPLTVASTTNVANLNASSLNGATFAAPGSIGSGTPSSGAFTTLNSTGQYTNTVATGSAPFVVSSTTQVSNLNVSQLVGNTWAVPASIGSSTPNAGAFTTLSASGVITSTVSTGTAPFTIASTTVVTNLHSTNSDQLGGATFASPTNIGSGTPASGAFTTLSATGVITSTLSTGTAPFTVASTTQVSNLNVSKLEGGTWEVPGTIGSTTPNTGAFSTISATGQITSTVTTGSAPFVVSSTTNVANLNASSLSGATFSAPGAIGGGTPSSGAFTTISATSQITSTLADGTAPFVVTSTTQVSNLNVSKLVGGTWAIPNALGSTTPNTGAFTTVSATGQITSTLADGTAPFVITSTTNVANLNASSLSGKTFASPAAIGTGTPASGAFTTISATGAITSTLATGTAPFTITSTTQVSNLNVSKLEGNTWEVPGTIGSTTRNTARFTTLDTNGKYTATGTVLMSSEWASDAYQFSTAGTGSSLTVLAAATNIIMNQTTTLAAFTFVLPDSATFTDGHLLTFRFNSAVTTITWTLSGSDIASTNNPTTALAGQALHAICRLTRWSISN